MSDCRRAANLGKRAAKAAISSRTIRENSKSYGVPSPCERSRLPRFPPSTNSPFSLTRIAASRKSHPVPCSLAGAIPTDSSASAAHIATPKVLLTSLPPAPIKPHRWPPVQPSPFFRRPPRGAWAAGTIVPSRRRKPIGSVRRKRGWKWRVPSCGCTLTPTSRRCRAAPQEIRRSWAWNRRMIRSRNSRKWVAVISPALVASLKASESHCGVVAVPSNSRSSDSPGAEPSRYLSSFELK